MKRQQLALSARPRSFKSMVGQSHITDRISAQVGKGLVQNAFLLVGPRGSGKTTLARIMALAFQCDHQNTFGNPCKVCRLDKSSFDIHEINAAKISGVRELEDSLEGAEYAPRAGNYRVYIIDECHRSSENAQDLLLKYVEDAPESTIYILCSTKAYKIVETLQSRCMYFQMRELELDDIVLLADRLLKKVDSDLPADRLAEALVEKGIGSPRLIANAVEKYIAGSPPDEAAEVESATSVDIKPLTRAVIKGHWDEAANFLAKAQASDVNSIRLGMVAYLKTLLLRSSDTSGRPDVISKAILLLCDLQKAEEVAMSGGLTAVLYKITAFFSRYAVG